MLVWNPSLWMLRTRLTCIVNVMFDNDLRPLLLTLTLIAAWISNHMPGNVWDEITYLFLNFQPLKFRNGWVISSHTWWRSQDIDRIHMGYSCFSTTRVGEFLTGFINVQIIITEISPCLQLEFSKGIIGLINKNHRLNWIILPIMLIIFHGSWCAY